MTDIVVFVPLTQGKVATIDFADLDKIRGHKWCFFCPDGTHGYAQSRIKNKVFTLHRLLMGLPVGKLVDHVNGDGLDNRRNNLRVVTASQNTHNSIKPAGCSSKFKGVSWNKRDKKWEVKFTISLGEFESEEAAAKAFDAYVRPRQGKFARYNFPEVGEQSAVRKI